MGGGRATGLETNQYKSLRYLLTTDYEYIVVVREGLRGTDFLSAEQAWECDKINYRDPHKAAVLNHRALRKTFTLRARQGLFHIENGIRSPSNESMSLTVLLYTRLPPETKIEPSHQYCVLQNNAITPHVQLESERHNKVWIINGPLKGLQVIAKNAKDFRWTHQYGTTPTGDSQLSVCATQDEGSPPPGEILNNWAKHLDCTATLLKHYKLESSEMVVGVSRPNAKDELTARAVQRLLPRVVISAGRGKYWVVLPKAGGWEEEANNLLENGFKVTTTNGPWTLTSKSGREANVTICNLPLGVTVREICNITSISNRNLFAIDIKSAEPLTQNVSYFGEGTLSEALAPLQKAYPEVWLRQRVTLNNTAVSSQEWPW